MSSCWRSSAISFGPWIFKQKHQLAQQLILRKLLTLIRAHAIRSMIARIISRSRADSNLRRCVMSSSTLSAQTRSDCRKSDWLKASNCFFKSSKASNLEVGFLWNSTWFEEYRACRFWEESGAASNRNLFMIKFGRAGRCTELPSFLPQPVTGAMGAARDWRGPARALSIDAHRRIGSDSGS